MLMISDKGDDSDTDDMMNMITEYWIMNLVLSRSSIRSVLLTWCDAGVV